MTSPVLAAAPSLFAEALARRGFTALTPVQEAVLDPRFVGHDLRISSRTGSGKTVAIGFILRGEIQEEAVRHEQERPARGARPMALIIAPTRELAAQIGGELSWLFESAGATVAVVTGGTSFGEECRVLQRNPMVIVGTPGRLLDHLERRTVDPAAVRAVVLDEADQMLDLGFREALEAILDKTPPERRTHLVSATLEGDVLRLADRYQKDSMVVRGSGDGGAHDDIVYEAHLVQPSERYPALVNLLLLAPGERTLVFVRTRVQAAELADRLTAQGFSARSLSGDLEQRERTQTLEAFRAGAVTTLVATDVAARGIDVADVGRVIHANPPGDVEMFTHRSGRTGRAGRKGASVLLVPPAVQEQVGRLLRRARVRVTWTDAPGPADVLRAADQRLAAEVETAARDQEADPRALELARELLGRTNPETLVAALLTRMHQAGPCKPNALTAVASPRAPAPVARRSRPSGDDRPPPQSTRQRTSEGFTPFRVTWGQKHGADARRMLALVCRRGEIPGNQVGAIRIGDITSTVQIAVAVAVAFAQAAQRPDPRDPRIKIDLEQGGPPPATFTGRPSSSSSPPAPAGRPSSSSPPAPAGRSAPPPAFAGRSSSPPAFAGRSSSPPAFAGRSSSPPAFTGRTAPPPAAFAGRTAPPPAFAGRPTPPPGSAPPVRRRLVPQAATGRS